VSDHQLSQPTSAPCSPARTQRPGHEHARRRRPAHAPEVGTRLARQRMIERYIGLADQLARRYRHTSEPLEDLVQVARLGLVKAVDRWDPHRGVAFSTFAVPTITGELRRYFRDRTWTVRPPRDLQDLYLDVQRVRESLFHQLRREPTAGDVAAELGRTVEEILEAVDAGDAYSPRSLDSPLRNDDGHTWLDQVPETRDDLGRTENATALSQLGAVLDNRSWEIVRLRFEEDLIQREIGERVGCSQMHVSRILRDSLVRLRAAAHEAGHDFD
jgi:RNA polymerase sigma-B factor